ncbi:hypothetical protein [Streptomyces sp. NPDC102360]|uniref:hypothetical protein n=1 Tax=Streptomyces sp. NPDC102360 TaxID=3366160 RepID=UPI003817B311
MDHRIRRLAIFIVLIAALGLIAILAGISDGDWEGFGLGAAMIVCVCGLIVTIVRRAGGMEASLPMREGKRRIPVHRRILNRWNSDRAHRRGA